MEDARRRNTYFENRRQINEHNKLYETGNVTYRMSLNEYSDLSHSEFVAQMNGAKRPPPKYTLLNHHIQKILSIYIFFYFPSVRMA